MDWLSILLLVLVGIWFVAAIIYMIKHKGCGCGCSSCNGKCSECKKHCKSK